MSDRARDLPIESPHPSTLHVYRTLLLASNALSVSELVDRTGYSREGIRIATTELLEAGVIAETYGTDGRERRYET